MSAVIPRKCYEPGGFAYEFTGGKCKPLPPDVAYLVSDWTGEHHRVTWDEVLKERREKQERILDRIYQEPEPAIVPCYVWTFFNKQDIPYHGWYCYVMTRHRDCQIAVNFLGFKAKLAESIMRAIPLGILPVENCFTEWMENFAKAFPRKKHPKDPRKAGSRIGWLKDREIFTLERPAE